MDKYNSYHSKLSLSFFKTNLASDQIKFTTNLVYILLKNLFYSFPPERNVIGFNVNYTQK